jgi:biotin transporter BioY
MSLVAGATMMLVYIPGDLVKLVAAVIIAKRVKAGV